MNEKDIKKSIEGFINEGRLEEAVVLIGEFKNLIAIDDEILGMEAIVHLLLMEYEKALECVREGLLHNIFNEDLYFTMGNVYEALGNNECSYLCYQYAINLTINLDKKRIMQERLEWLSQENSISVKNTSIILITYNNLKYTKVCIDSIRMCRDSQKCEIVVVDNNSTDGTKEWLKGQSDIKVILNDKNEGFPAGCNQGINIANEENDIFLLNNDTVIMSNSIFNLRMALYSRENVGAVGSISNSVSYCQQINKVFDTFGEYIDYARTNNICDPSRYEERLKLVGFAMLIKRKCLNEVGLLDERFTPGNFEDDDISLRILTKGYKLLLCKDSYIHHFGSVSFGSDKMKFSNLLQENSKKFKDKWGFSSEYSMGIRHEIVNLIEEKKEEKLNVLEVGCACGGTLLKIKNDYPNSNIYGIELNEKSANISSCFANVEAKNIEKYELGYEEEFFDYIIFADVLEHLVNPEVVLDNMRRYLKPDGHIIISLPNIMHISVVKNIINGRFPYADCGILDRTHLRFFTLFEIQEMVGKQEYEMEKCLSNIVNTSDEDAKLIDTLCGLSDERFKSQYLAYQYIIKIKKKLITSTNKYEEYVNYIHNKDKFLTSREECTSLNYKFKSGDSKLIAYYLPQFHLNEDNNKWWGRGSTEWDNVARAIPQYTGHYQPRLPKDMGFYSLDSIETFKRQIELAKGCGIFGFSIYYYLSDDKKLLRKPLEILFDNKNLDIPYCLYWANEDWTAGYKSECNDILVKQSDGVDSYKNAINDMEKYLLDERYIKIDNKKLIMIYKPFSIPETKEVFNHWREHCRSVGIGEIYIMATKGLKVDLKDYYDLGFDGVNEFSPQSNLSDYNILNHKIDFMREDFSGHVLDYAEYVNKKRYLKNKNEKIYKCIIPGWDNTARKLNKALIFHGESPELYYKWLTDVMTLNKSEKILDDDIVFINAWNEWGEGAILEPCSKYGYSYLNKTKEAVINLRKEK